MEESSLNDKNSKYSISCVGNLTITVPSIYRREGPYVYIVGGVTERPSMMDNKMEWVISFIHKSVYFILMLLLPSITKAQTPNYYYGHTIVEVDSAFKSWLNWDELLYLDETEAKWVVVCDTVPKFNGVEEVFEWYSGIRGFYLYCLGDIVVRYDPEQKIWYYEALNNKLQHIKWQDTKRGRRVYEHIEDKNGKTLRHYDAHDPKMIMCWGYGCGN